MSFTPLPRHFRFVLAFPTAFQYVLIYSNAWSGRARQACAYAVRKAIADRLY